MPQSSQSPLRSTSTNNVLLIEEYDALAAAISSALKKFAPHHSVSVARSLLDAETLARSICPSLLVIDFDPAYPRLTEFLFRMRDVCPDARGLIIGAGVSDEIAAEFRTLGALYFVKKPFEVADFGAAVQALLGPVNSESLQLRGNMGSLGLADVVLAQCAGGRSVVFKVHGKKDKSGEIHVVNGQLFHAVEGRRKNTGALEEMFSWTEPRIEELEKTSSGTHTIHEPWADVLLDALRQVRPRRPVAPVEAVSTKPRSKSGKKLVVIDDTEMLLMFVEDTLTIADPELQITTAPNGTTGVKEVERLLPDLVLLDFSLPDINGDDVCRRLLRNERTARIPVLMMSGHVPEMTAAAASFGNIVATIPKPFMSEALVALVQQTLNAGPRVVTVIPKHVEASATKQIAKPAPPPKAASRQKQAGSTPVVAKPPPLPTPVPLEPVLAPVRATPIAPPQIEIARSSTISTPVVSHEGNEVVLGLFLEVVSMQLTPSLRMGAIRAKPSSLTVSLHASPAVLPVETGFQLGRVELDAAGKIDKVCLIPTLQPFQRLETRNALEIGALDVVPHNSRDHVQLTPTQNAPMKMHLLAHLELVGVELGANFQVAQVVLKSRSTTVRVTLSAEAVGGEKTGVFCEMAAVQLDGSARIAETLLKPLK